MHIYHTHIDDDSDDDCTHYLDLLVTMSIHPESGPESCHVTSPAHLVPQAGKPRYHEWGRFDISQATVMINE